MTEAMEARLVMAFEKIAAEMAAQTARFGDLMATQTTQFAQWIENHKSRHELEAMDLELKKINHANETALHAAIAAKWTQEDLEVAAEQIIDSKVGYQHSAAKKAKLKAAALEDGPK